MGWDCLTSKRYRLRQPVGAAYALVLAFLAHPTFWGVAIGTCLIVLGSVLRLWASGHVHKNEALATSGPYSVVRHPQYLGNTLIAVGLWPATGNYWGIPLWIAIFWLLYVPAVRREDKKLERRFGDHWRQWRSKTPAVFPRRLPSPSFLKSLFQWSPSRSVQNGEPVWQVGILVVLVMLFLRME